MLAPYLHNKGAVYRVDLLAIVVSDGGTEMRKALGVSFTVLAAAAIWALAGSNTQAFHSGGVAECTGCHSMHSPRDVASGFLLIGGDQSSTCLTCHQQAGLATPNGYHIATADADMGAGIAPKQRTPGGDFGWLKKDYSWVPRAGSPTSYSYGRSHGHNIVAVDNSFVADADNATAPGGTYASADLNCISCHDPHSPLRRMSDGTLVRGQVIGQATAPIMGSGSYDNSVDPPAGQAVGVYRLLRGWGGTYKTATFDPVAIAVAPATYNQTEATNQVRVAYGSSGTDTWGNWCASCHPAMHSNGNYVHPIDRALGSDANIYNAYVKTADLTGTSANSYSSLTPFAENTGDLATLRTHAKNTNAYLNGPSSNDQVMCLSCHRAHASGWDYSLRWNMEGEFIVYNSLYPGTDTTPTNPNFAQGRTGAETAAAYYDRPVTQFANYQRVLCNKCHAKD